MKKLFSMVFAGFMVFGLMGADASALEFKAEDWKTADGAYGFVEVVNDNIMNFKGATTEIGGMNYGPFNKTSEGLIEDGIKEELYVEIDPEKMSLGETFEPSVSLDDSTDNYVTELLVDVAKVDAEKVRITVGLDRDFSYDITEKGVYTFKWEMYKKEGKAYAKFSLLLWDEELNTTKEIDLDCAENTTKASNVAENAVSVRSVLFTSIKVEEGVNLYKELPPKPVVPEEPKEDIKNPQTGDIDLFFMGLISVLSVGALTFTIKKMHA